MVKDCTFQVVLKGWGRETWLVNNDKYCGKFLDINAGKRFSYHYHAIKDEYFYVLVGEVTLIYSWHNEIEKAEKTILKCGQGFHIPVGLRHQVIANQDTRIVEFSTHHEDSDSYRVIKGD